MNKERILDLADFLENEVSDKHFSMHNWVCGTTACIGGWCEARQKGAAPGDYLGSLDFSGPEAAEAYLGLTDEQEQLLFYPSEDEAWCAQCDPLEPDFISRTRAIATLRHLAETGEVNWNVST